MGKNNEASRKDTLKNMVLLHGGFAVLSLALVSQKFAGESDSFIGFALFIGLAVFILAVYSVLWQILLLRVSLSAAFSHRGVLVIWGFFWGFIIFGERITTGQIIAACLIFIGIIIIGKVKNEERDDSTENLEKTATGGKE